MGQPPHGASHCRVAPGPGCQSFCHAIEVASSQGTKSWELRAAMNLARLWQQGKRAEAQQMLAEVYSWFIEGFGTDDLQEARALLAEWAPP